MIKRDASKKIMKHRKPNRINNYDYSEDGWYFVTMVTKDREDWFGQIDNTIINSVPMVVGTGFKPVPTEMKPVPTEMKPVPTGIKPVHIDTQPISTGTEINIIKRHGLSEFVRALKTFSSRQINEISKEEFAWQRSFYDRIIRNEKEYINIQNYIKNNPVNWIDDELNN